MYGIFVNENGRVPFAQLLVSGYKTIETRNKDMLSALVGQRVAVVRTRRNKKPTVLGYVTITAKAFCKANDFDNYFEQHFVQPKSKYDTNNKGKWFYYVSEPEECNPYELPVSAVRHGRSWCEF